MQQLRDCCRIPGIFLPREIDPVGSYLRLDRRDLFRRYLIAELFTPVMELSSDNAERTEALRRENEIIRVDITLILNGRAGTSKPFYGTHR
jgi:hypothetical protein